MNSPGGGFFPKPLWHPPISTSWIFSILVLIGASNVEALPPAFLTLVLTPLGFFFVFMIALFAYELGAVEATFALLFFLLMIWSHNQYKEGFASGTVDWVQNNKRWFAEVVLKEKPVGIKEKDVTTYPVQGDSSSSK
jgi:signal transduction histidine kinase